MGRSSEDVFDCKKCEHTVVYEPTEGKFQTVACYECKATHTVYHAKPVIELVEQATPDNGKRVYVEFQSVVVPNLLGEHAEIMGIAERAAVEVLAGRVEADGGNTDGYTVDWKPLARLGIDRRFLVLAIRKPLTFDDVHQEVADIIQGAGNS